MREGKNSEGYAAADLIGLSYASTLNFDVIVFFILGTLHISIFTKFVFVEQSKPCTQMYTMQYLQIIASCIN